MTIYKHYPTNGKPICYNTLRALRNSLDLNDEETTRCFYPGTHKLSDGSTVITYKD
jgi:hypothetical protein